MHLRWRAGDTNTYSSSWFEHWNSCVMDSLITEVTNWEDLRKNGTRIAQTVLKLEKNEQHTETKAKNRHKTAHLGQVSWLKHVRFCLHTSLKKLKVFLLNEKKCNTLVPQIFRPLRWGEVWIADFPLLFFWCGSSPCQIQQYRNKYRSQVCPCCSVLCISSISLEGDFCG